MGISFDTNFSKACYISSSFQVALPLLLPSDFGILKMYIYD